MHDIANDLYCKMSGQADDQKTVYTYRGASADDAKRINDAPNNQYLRVDGNPSDIREMNLGGVDQKTMAFFLQTQQQISRFAGNLDALAGLAVQAGTLGQEEIIKASSSLRIDDMKDQVVGAVRRLIKDIAYYEWGDPLADPVIRKVIGGEAIVETSFPESRQGEFSDYKIDIDPYSMSGKTPSGQLASMMRALNEVILPMMPLIQQQGGTFDLREFLRKYGKLANLPDLDRLVVFSNFGQEKDSSSQPIRQSPNTHRITERISRSVPTPEGETNEMVKALMGSQSEGALAQTG